MKKLLVVTLAALVGFGAIASARSVVSYAIDDSAIDYSEPTLDADPYGYIWFEQDADGLVLSLSTSEVDGSLPVIYLAVPDLGADQFGLALAADVTDLEGLALGSYGGRFSALAVEHLSVDVPDVYAAYEAALVSLGFTSSVEQQGDNVWIASFASADGVLRAVFHQSGTSVTVNLAAA